VERRLGRRFGIIFRIVSTLFPNFFFLGSTACTSRVWRPALGADPPALKNRGLKDKIAHKQERPHTLTKME
jgi:hypothetical protein